MTFYHPTIEHLDAAACEFHQMGLMAEKNAAHRLAGGFQQTLLERSPYPRNRRFLHPQWAWATGHIGLLYMLTRWFRTHEPETQLVLGTETAGCPPFLAYLNDLVTVVPALQKELEPEIMHNAVFFGCPDGTQSLVQFYKMVEQTCKDVPALHLTTSDRIEADNLLAEMGVQRPYVAFQARKLDLDPARNVSTEEINTAVAPYLARGYGIVSTGLDNHPVNAYFPTVRAVKDPMRASFLLNANCDQFIGSNSGAWTIAHAFGRSCEIMNDTERAAWIYP